MRVHRGLVWVVVVGIIAVLACETAAVSEAEQLDSDEGDAPADVCEMCSFSGDEQFCREVPCKGGCLYNKKYYPIDEEFAAADGCNRCVCADYGVVTCSENDCNG